MRRLQRLFTPLAVIALACASSTAPPAGEGGAPAPGDNTASIPFKGDALVFPPEQTRRKRRPLPRRLGEVSEAASETLAVASPELDDAGQFEFAGQTVRVRFSRKIEGASEGKAAPPLTITPPVAGKATWESPFSMAFRANDPFDPDQTYALAVGPVKDEDGTELDTWKATFRADPQLWIAGKLISYVPKKGEPRVVAVTPYSGATVGSRPKIQVLFDQSVSTGAAAKLLRLTNDDTKAVVKTSVKLASGRKFDGTRVDPGYAVTVTSKGRLKAGGNYTFEVHDFGDTFADAASHSLDIANPLKFIEANCGWRSEGCSWSGKKLEISGREFVLAFNNQLDDKHGSVKKTVEVTPPVKNLSVWVDRWSSNGKVTVSGAFKPSTTYTVRLPAARDAFGSALPRPVEFRVRTAPMVASVSMPGGIQFLDGQRSRTFAVSTRNVDKALLRFWEVGETHEAWREANNRVSRRELPPGDALVEITVDPKERLNKQIATKVDLLKHLEPGKSYVAALELDDADIAFKATRPKYASWSWAAKPPVSLVTVNDDQALVVHARSGHGETLVHVSRLGPGDPLKGAKFFLDDKPVKGVLTDAFGFARLPLGAAEARQSLLRVEHDGRRGLLALDQRSQTERDLVPELSGGATGSFDKVRALVISDRGVYRPGATIHFKSMLRTPSGGELSPLAYVPVHFKLVDPNGKTAFEQAGTTNDMGSFAASWKSDGGAEIGRYRAIVESAFKEGELASTGIQVAEFEPPRFKVDVRAKAAAKALAATVEGRYLFGAAMDGADATWTLRRSTAPIPAGALRSRGLNFRRRYYSGSEWTRTGSGKLDSKGKLAVTPALELDKDLGPQRFMLEAEVTDESHRAIAGRGSVVVHTADHYAGVSVKDRWADVGTKLDLELGVIDQDGNTVAGKAVEASLVRLWWKRTRRPGPGGSVRVDWHEVEKKVGSCKATSAVSVVSCDLVPRKSGTYEVRTKLGKNRGGSVRLWVYGGGSASTEPSPGHRVEVLPDQKSYAPGDVAKVMVRSPFDEATAIFTVEQGAVLTTERRIVKGGASEFTVPVKAQHAPHVHATVTLLPIGAKGEGIADWKFGAAKVPVKLDGVRLGIDVASDKPFYEPGGKAGLTVTVQQGGKPVKNAEVALAVVDEGVLRLTNFKAADPVTALRPGAALRFGISDTRRSLAEMLERSRVAGDGAGDDGSASLVSTRKNFVRTALWRPNLRTNAEGKVSVDLELPDNLTEFRMMAVVLDDKGRGGKASSSFEVRKPLMIIPAVPRFALAGDRFEAAVLVHNGKDEPVTATVKLGERSQAVEIGARGRSRVAFEMNLKDPGTQKLVFSVEDSAGVVRDKVEAKVPVQSPGIDERPRLAGSFTTVQEILLEVPEAVTTDLRKNEHVVVTFGHHMWPELGLRLEYLVDYPHGCVEQTTSSTLPLLAARDILPRLGFVRYTGEEIDERTAAGIKRLASMRTSSGGLAYWPGGWDPNVYGTAYAMRAVALAAKKGIEEPGLLDGMAKFLVNRLHDDSGSRTRTVEVRSSIALALAEAGQLPESSADMLMDTVEKQGVFGLANLALALSTLENQDERVADLLTRLEGSFNEYGAVIHEAPDGEFHYYGSSTRTKAQAALALTRLRPQAKVLPLLIGELVRATRGYSTQSTAFGLLALREHIVGQDAAEGTLHARLDGIELTPASSREIKMAPGTARFEIPFEQVAGRRALLRLEAGGEVPVSFVVDSKWRRPLTAKGTRVATSAANGPEMYRVYTDAKGEALDLAKVAPGQVIRVALLGRFPDTVDRERLGYLAMTDRLPAGFEPIQPDLWTVSRPPELSEKHPMAHMLRYGSAEASHVELRDDRVHMYFDRVWGDFAAGTYLMRATTPGKYTVPPAMGELMYEPDSTGYSKSLEVTVVR